MSRLRTLHLNIYVMTMSLICLAGILFTVLPAEAESPYARPNNSWISISGTVEDVGPDSFTLDYGDGEIKVEMDDGDRDADAYALLAGDKVIVNGKIDDDLYELSKIEASSVYVEKINTTFFASAVDEEDYGTAIIGPVEPSYATVHGTVTSVDDEEFTVNSGVLSLRVEVDEMIYNPLDDEGYQKIEAGDFVRVTGRIDDDLIEGRELVAETVVEILD